MQLGGPGSVVEMFSLMLCGCWVGYSWACTVSRINIRTLWYLEIYCCVFVVILEIRDSLFFFMI